MKSSLKMMHAKFDDDWRKKNPRWWKINSVEIDYMVCFELVLTQPFKFWENGS